MHPSRPADLVVEQFLASLDAASSTVRQRRWAAADLIAYTRGRSLRRPTVVEALAPQNVADWLAHHDEQGTSLPGRRARAATARALEAYARERALLPADVEEQRVPLPAPVPVEVHVRRARRLLAVTTGAAPYAVHHQIWCRFTAHVHVLAATGATDAQLTAVRVRDLDLAAGVVRVAGVRRELPDVSRHVVERWLEVRTQVVRTLEGSDPLACWLRVHPGHDRRTGALAPAGLPISARGLRHSFTTVVGVLGATVPGVGGVQSRDVRALGRDLDDVRRPSPPTSLPTDADVDRPGQP